MGNFAGEDCLNPAVQLTTPRAMADRNRQLYKNASDMHAMLQPGRAYALQFIVLYHVYSLWCSLGVHYIITYSLAAHVAWHLKGGYNRKGHTICACP